VIRVTLDLATDHEDDTLSDIRDWAEQVEQHGCIDSYGYVFNVSEIGISVHQFGEDGGHE